MTMYYTQDQIDVRRSFNAMLSSHIEDAEAALPVSEYIAGLHIRMGNFWAIMTQNFEANQLHIDGDE